MRVFLVGLLPLAAAHTTISVSTPTALREAITDGAHIEVANDMVIDEEFVIPPGYDVEISSTNRATLVATNWASHFRIDGKLRLENLVLTNGTALRNVPCSIYVGGGAACSGGALHVDEGASLVLVDCVVANSTSGYWGGALYGYKSDVIEIYGTTFIGNYVDDCCRGGGAIYTHEHKTLVKISGSRFVSNYANKAGALQLGGDTEIFDTQFIGNRATSSSQSMGTGGAVLLHAGALTISGSTFRNNEAVTGGAIYVYPSTGVLTVISSIFDGNVGDGTISFLKDTTGQKPVIDCEASCDSLGGGSCTPLECGGCPPGDDCDMTACACYSCDCAYPTFPTPQPTGPSPAPTVTRAPTLAPHDASWWRANAGTTDGAAGSALSPLAVLAAILVLVANEAASLKSVCIPTPR